MIKNSSPAQIVLYQTDDGQTKLQVQLSDETVWLTQDQIADLYQKGRSTITEHIKNIISEGELIQNSVCREFRRTGTDNKDYLVKYYNLEMIIAVGYRVKSPQGTQFRIWATARLKEYIIKGFALDDERLKQEGGKSRYFQELLERIRDIRNSERKVLTNSGKISNEEAKLKAEKELKLYREQQNKVLTSDFDLLIKKIKIKK